jgi:hypothetical protein
MMAGYIYFANSSKMPVVNKVISTVHFQISFGRFHHLKGSTKARFVLGINKSMKNNNYLVTFIAAPIVGPQV